MAIAPWGALGAGTFKTEAQRKATPKGMSRRVSEPSANTIAVVSALETIAKRKNTEITSIALAYVMHKAPYVFPIVGGRTVEQLKANIQALRVELSASEMEEIESAAPFEIGFPGSMIGQGPVNWLNAIGGACDWVAPPKVYSPLQL
jgi:aryl-alcohol dehydrogenase-like predicted oxidoreductase